MPQIEQLTDKAALQAFFEQRRALNAYALRDLDEPHWSRTEWFAFRNADRIEEVALLYHGIQPSILIALTNNSIAGMLALLDELRDSLPGKVYAHLSPGLRPSLETRFNFEDHGPHRVMKLVEPGKVLEADSRGVEQLGKRDLDEMQALDDASYPGHWFSATMLDNGPYVGLRDEAGELLSIAGVHVFSERYAVAALGNIVTRPELSGRGYGKRVTAGLCQALLPGVKTIALNVQAENAAANKMYAGLGFEAIADYGEYMLVSSG